VRAPVTSAASAPESLSAYGTSSAQDLSLRGAELAVGLLPQATPKDVVEGAFGFAGAVLQQQKAYALQMTEILTGPAEPARSRRSS